MCACQANSQRGVTLTVIHSKPLRRSRGVWEPHCGIHCRRAVFLFALCFGHLCCCCHQIPGDPGKQFLGRVVLPLIVQVQSIMVEKTWQQECEAAAYVIVHSEETEREMLCSALFLLSIRFRTPGHWRVLPTVRVGLPSSINSV